MKRYSLLTIFILLTFLLIQPSQNVFAENGLEASLHQAELYGRDGKFDFAFLELREVLRKYPEGPHIAEVEFAMGEYFFLQRNFREAQENFLRCLSSIQPDSIPRFLCQVYLSLCQEKSGGPEASKELRAKFKQELSSQKFFVAFDDKRTRSWDSPLGTTYTLHEFVDHLEILQNGRIFYTITIP